MLDFSAFGSAVTLNLGMGNKAAQHSGNLTLEGGTLQGGTITATGGAGVIAAGSDFSSSPNTLMRLPTKLA